MNEKIFVFFDIAMYAVQGLLLVMLLKNAQTRFFRKKSYLSQAILLTGYVAVQMFLHDSVLVKRLFYGKSMVVNNTRMSSLLVLNSMLVTGAVCLLLLSENRLKITYYVVTFYAVMELLKMVTYPILSWLLTRLVLLNQYFFDQQLYGEKMFYSVIAGIDVLWNLLAVSLILIFLYVILKQIKKYLEMKDNYQKSELIFLLIPGPIGLLLCLIMRSIMLSIQGNDIESLLDKRPEMNILIPVISLLCIFLILLVAKMLRKLIDESNQKIEISVYQDRIREMEQHIGDIENLYAGIRGMKHDMKNYIADMEALLSTESETKSAQTAFRQYLGSLQNSVEQMDMKYHTGNPVTDVIIQRYVQLAKNNAIDFWTDFLFPSNMNLDAFDISIIINNGLDNAMEACRRQKEGKRFIELTAYRRENMFFIMIKNSFDGTLKKNEPDGRLLTSKNDSINHGLGLRNIEVCAEKYFGKAETAVKDQEFELAVMLQGRM